MDDLYGNIFISSTCEQYAKKYNYIVLAILAITAFFVKVLFIFVVLPFVFLCLLFDRFHWHYIMVFMATAIFCILILYITHPDYIPAYLADFKLLSYGNSQLLNITELQQGILKLIENIIHHRKSVNRILKILFIIPFINIIMLVSLWILFRRIPLAHIIKYTFVFNIFLGSYFLITLNSYYLSTSPIYIIVSYIVFITYVLNDIPNNNHRKITALMPIGTGFLIFLLALIAYKNGRHKQVIINPDPTFTPNVLREYNTVLNTLHKQKIIDKTDTIVLLDYQNYADIVYNQQKSTYPTFMDMRTKQGFPPAYQVFKNADIIIITTYESDIMKLRLLKYQDYIQQNYTITYKNDKMSVWKKNEKGFY